MFLILVAYQCDTFSGNTDVGQDIDVRPCSFLRKNLQKKESKPRFSNYYKSENAVKLGQINLNSTLLTEKIYKTKLV